MTMKARLLMSAAIASIAAAMTVLYAQPVKVNKKFDKVSKPEIEMSVYAPDTTAAAVVLLDVGKTAITFDAEGRICLQTHHHERIKILKEEGVSHGDYELIYYNKSGSQDKITGIHVITYNRVNGESVRTKMSRDYIFDEEFTGNYRKLSFSAQDVRAGSVIDVEYDITSYLFLDFDKVYFQRDIPVNLVEYEVHIPEFAKANKRVTGYNRIRHKSENVNERYTLVGNFIDFKTTVDYYSGQELPAMKKEPYSYSFRQYLSAVDYDISSLELPGRLPKHFSVNWEDIDNNYYDSPITARMNDKCLFAEGTKEIMESGNTDAGKIMAIRDMVRSEISWDGNYRLFPKRGSQIYKEKSGSNADLNAIIASCLRTAGYRAEPVLIKMRSSGILIPQLPEMHPYDTFILRVENSSGEVHYLDGGSPHLYLDILPPEFLVSSGRLLRQPGYCQWVDLTNLTKSATVWLVNAKLDEDGTMRGNITAKYTGEDSYTFKRSVKKAGSEAEYVNLFENICQIDVEEYSFRNLDTRSNDCVFTCSFVKEIDKAGDRMYVSPFLMKFHSATDFSAPERSCPVEFPYRNMINYILNLELPENHVAGNLPENSSIGLPCLKTACKMAYSTNGNRIQSVYNFLMTDILAIADDYTQVREFWKLMCEIYDETIVISKTGE